MNVICKITGVFASILMMASFVMGGGLSIGSYQGAIGETVCVQVVVQSVSNVASVQLQLNYDPNLVNVIAVTNQGAVGGQFLMGYKDNNGYLDVVMACDKGSCSVTGILLDIEFRVNDGALPGMSTELVIARMNLGGDYGVPLGVQNALNQHNGELSVVPSEFVDSDGDGISDSWCWQYFGAITNIDLLADDDHDGLDNRSEYVAGTDPQDASSVLKMGVPGLTNSARGFVLKWSSVAGKFYRIDRSTNLIDGFNDSVQSHIEASPPENTYLDTSSTNLVPYFYRIGVE